MQVVLSLLNTKLTIPPLAGGIIPRLRLIARLSEARPLTILSAPPGFGKTTALIAWLRQLATATDPAPPAISWLSLDDDDNDPVRFWSYVIAALQTSACHLTHNFAAVAKLCFQSGMALAFPAQLSQ